VILVKPLSELAVKNARPSEKTYKIFDGRGLYLEVLPSGTKSWRLKYSDSDGRDRRYSFGRYPEVTLKQVREMAANFRVQLKNGSL
jgi:hypothetical protein